MSAKAQNNIPPIIGASNALKAAMRDAKHLAASDLPVLITGETGTGKELIAEAIYRWWVTRRGDGTGTTPPTSDGPFHTFNCAAIPDELAESELFGYEAGAFTGARQRRNGLFKQADGGALFLDEVGDLSLVVQAKLLRALQLGEIRPLGGERIIRVRVRVIGATNKNLRAEVKAGRFREDLFYRLNANVPVCLPPLRERRSDIPALIDFALERLVVKTKGPRKRVRRDGLALLMSYEWPGNVRELLQAVETAAALCRGTGITRAALARALGVTNIGEGSSEDAGTAAVREATERGKLSAGRLRDLTGCSKKEAHSVLRDLQRRGKIARRGQGRATYYVAADAPGSPKEPAPATRPVHETTSAATPPAVVKPATPPDLNARQAELVATLPVGERVTTGEYCRRFGVGRVTAFRDLDALAKANMLSAVGRGRGAAYVRCPAG